MKFQPEDYDRCLQEKVVGLQELFGPLFPDDKRDVFASAPRHYRQRVRFAITTTDEGYLSYGLFNRGKLNPIAAEFPVASRAICELMPELLRALNDSPP
eukprot:CAMPEP_0119330668 /NCGR_PEP_ID=MMETSP1333-20130426/78726_1 /TAXON_ID=418940 /ORGANISM="Scyphosphaera apsteinii, Strain RCC1455" /LENGTH=98 /DNA_ID=CAMNT_0007340085 /DNA_START=1 /DNA_END=294 /DNA_ORIENTATION=+